MIRLLWAALALATVPACGDAAPRLDPLSVVTWAAENPAFGGFSAVAVLDAGSRFLVISDRGAWALGTFERRDGRLSGAALSEIGPLLGVEGKPLIEDETDAEDLAIDAEGRIWVSFEHLHRVRRYDHVAGPASHVDPHPDFAGLQRNSGLEALAVDADGVLYAVPERSGEWERPFPVYRLRDGSWDHALELRRTGKFLITSADFGPDGKLYILERDLSWLGGFASRVRRFSLGPNGFDAGSTLLETEPGKLDNMEGISVWRDAEQRVRVTLISDDNFFPLQKTMFAEYVLVDD